MAQLGERRVRNAEVESSILFGSTKKSRSGKFTGTAFYTFLYQNHKNYNENMQACYTFYNENM